MNTTITHHCRLTHGTMMTSHRTYTVTRHPSDIIIELLKKFSSCFAYYQTPIHLISADYLFLKIFLVLCITCIAVAKAGLVIGPLRPSATLLGYLDCVIYSSKSFHFFLFKLCIMIVHILKMCTCHFVHIS